MKDDTAAAIADGIIKRRKLLGEVTNTQQKSLLELLFIDFFANQHLTLQKWANLTGQTAQVDTGYIAQFIASIVRREPGQGFRGKGDDLADGGEVKSAANLSGVDRPRWNHNLGTLADDRRQAQKGAPMRWQKYLDTPYLFYVLVDRVFLPQMHDSAGSPIRIRVWCIDAQRDEAWRSLVQKFVDHRAEGTYNFQLHPPVGHDDDLIVNTLGNLDFSDVLVFDARLTISPDGNHTVTWEREVRGTGKFVSGRTVGLPYEKSKKRASRFTSTSDIVADVALVPALFPTVLLATQNQAVDEIVENDIEV